MLRLLTMRRIVRLALVLSIFVWLGSIRAADLDPKAIAIHLPKDIKWVASPSGSENAVLVGDPDKPGLYVVLLTPIRKGYLAMVSFLPFGPCTQLLNRNYKHRYG